MRARKSIHNLLMAKKNSISLRPVLCCIADADKRPNQDSDGRAGARSGGAGPEAAGHGQYGLPLSERVSLSVRRRVGQALRDQRAGSCGFASTIGKRTAGRTRKIL